MKKCPPGVICIENVSMILIAICVFIIIYLIYNSFNGRNIILNNNNNPTEKIVINDNQRENSGWFGGLIPSWPYTNFVPQDPLLNPYAPPLRDERYFIPGFNGIPSGAVPINISTNIGAVDTTYRQLGILTPLNGSSKDNIVPLMGRPLFTNRDKWQYYSTSNQNNNVKLPVSRSGRSCTNEYGCDKLYNGDTVYIEGANETYKVTVYDNNVIKYLPFV
jgi:hypothetical protein